MTDKQIIDVNNCRFYRDEISFVHGETITDVCSIWIWQRDYSGLEPSCIMKCHCSDNLNCYYKQLKRKEQECEKLKEENFTFEQLIKEYEKYGAIEEIIQQSDQLKAENKKLEQALSEIKDIAEKAKKDICNNCAWKNTDSCDPEDYTCGEFIKILQLISEVDDDRQD